MWVQVGDRNLVNLSRANGIYYTKCEKEVVADFGDENYILKRGVDKEGAKIYIKELYIGLVRPE